MDVQADLDFLNKAYAIWSCSHIEHYTVHASALSSVLVSLLLFKFELKGNNISVIL